MRDDRPVNKNKVSKKMWDKWTLVGRHVFNRLYASMLENPEFYLPRGTPPPSDQVWKVTAWNSAFMAADLTSRGEKHLFRYLVREMTGRELKDVLE